MSDEFSFCCWDCRQGTVWSGPDAKVACPNCGSNVVRTEYAGLSAESFQKAQRGSDNSGLWRYFDFLPVLDRGNIVSGGEGNVPIDRWEFLEEFAKTALGIDCKVFAQRHDCHPSTGSFKDLSGSLVASSLKEHRLKDYVVASTGNIGVAFARYLAASGCTLYAFIPHDSPPFKEAEIACFGQNVFRVEGDYTAAKKLAAEFAAEKGFPLAGGTFDPLRIEAKKTMPYEWLRLMDEFPDVYIQALSGGTGPIGVDKGCSDLLSLGLTEKKTRLLLTQSDKCPPMATSWQKAKNAGFPADWHLSYDRLEDPETEIPTLATGNPAAYPRLAPVVRESDGDIFDFSEELAVSVARIVAFEAGVRIGSAGAVGVGGFFGALKRDLIRNGDVVLIAVGEGIRRDPDFMLKMVVDSQHVNSVSDCRLSKRADHRDSIWAPIQEYTNGF